MAGRSLSRARAEAEAERIRSASDTPTPPRDQPIPYSPDLCDEAILLADIGMVGAELAAHWAVSEETMQGWEKAHQDFADALQRARTRARAWWQRQPRLAIRAQDNKFPAGAWSQQVRALFSSYDDRQPIVIDIGQLVMIQRNRPEPLGERAADGAKPLIEGDTVRPRISLTAEGSSQTNLSDAAGGDLDAPGLPDPAEGG